MSVHRIRPATAFGRLRAPPSKSYTHRALAAGHLSGRRYRVDRPLDARDTRATAGAVARLGTPVLRTARHWTVEPSSTRRRPRSVSIDCGESGTTLRFVAALAALQDRPIRLEGSRGLGARPMDGLLRPLRRLGARTVKGPGRRGFPLVVTGPIRGGTVSVDSSESSQFASALLLALPTLPDDSVLTLTGRVVSRPYLDATLAVLAHHGLRLRRAGRSFSIPGGQRYRSTHFVVPGDASSAAYLWAAAAVTGGEVEVRGVPLGDRWPQADLRILPLLREYGAAVRTTAQGVSVGGGDRRPFTVDLTDSPDLYPLVGVLAAVAPGRSVLCGAEHVEVKESDRRRGTVRLARALGARVRAAPQGLVIEGTSSPRAFALVDLTDHRLVMSAAVGALAANGRSSVGDGSAVRKSFPGFWRCLGALTPAGGSS